jgi:hypothetical protein
VRRPLGYALLGASLLMWAAVPVLPFVLDLPAASLAGVTLTLAVAAELVFFAGVALLGRQLWTQLKARLQALAARRE